MYVVMDMFTLYPSENFGNLDDQIKEVWVYRQNMQKSKKNLDIEGLIRLILFNDTLLKWQMKFHDYFHVGFEFHIWKLFNQMWLCLGKIFIIHPSKLGSFLGGARLFGKNI